MELAPEKRQLHTQQRDERAEIHDALKQLEADFSKDLERIRQQVRKKSFVREITRARRYHEEKNVWEYLNNVVESIHGFVSFTHPGKLRTYLFGINDQTYKTSSPDRGSLIFVDKPLQTVYQSCLKLLP